MAQLDQVTMKPRHVPCRAKSELEGLTTRQLLGRLRSLLACEDAQEASDFSVEEVQTVEGIVFKNTAEWAAAYSVVKELLSGREHVPGGDERRQQRVERARLNRSSEKRLGR